MAKQYYIKKNPATSGPDVEWIAINGKEFYQLITSPVGRGRYFIDMDDFIIEASETEYVEWRREKNHSDYLRKQEKEIQCYRCTPICALGMVGQKRMFVIWVQILKRRQMRLYRKVLISEAPGINSPPYLARESSGANCGRRLRNFPSGGAFAVRWKRSGKENF